VVAANFTVLDVLIFSCLFQYTTGKDGSVMGVTVTRANMLNHSRTLTVACNYTEGEVMVCVLDFKRDVGLWHGVLTVRNKNVFLQSTWPYFDQKILSSVDLEIGNCEKVDHDSERVQVLSENVERVVCHTCLCSP
jgi:hypothetical protein